MNGFRKQAGVEDKITMKRQNHHSPAELDATVSFIVVDSSNPNDINLVSFIFAASRQPFSL